MAPAFAATKQAQIRAGIANIVDQNIQLSKWLIGSLLVLNSGAILALLNAGRSRVADPGIPAAWFLVGVFGALLNGWLVQFLSSRVLGWMQDAEAYWSLVATTGRQTEDSEKMIWAHSVKATRFLKWAPLPGWVSAIAFFWGAILTMRSLR